MDKDTTTSQAPVSQLLTRLLNFLGFGRGIDSADELEHEIQELIDDGEEQGLISHQEGKMINSILEFRDKSLCNP